MQNDKQDSLRPASAEVEVEFGGGHDFSLFPDPDLQQKINAKMIATSEINPKDIVGASKVSITKLPAAGVLHGAHAMMDGARKYGPYNWRSKPVQASIYVDAAMRHMQAWFEGEETAGDSGVHHLGHALACCAILLDAQETGNLVDDRPPNGEGVRELMKRLNETIMARSETRQDQQAQQAQRDLSWEQTLSDLENQVETAPVSKGPKFRRVSD